MKICFLDHHLNNYHADKFLSLLRGDLKDSGLELVSAYETDPTGDDWCEKNNVPRASSIEEAVQGADGVIVLAPDNIETHRAFAEQVLPHSKPTMFDKLLATTRDDAQFIADLAQQNKVKIFSSSSLRYAVEVEETMQNTEVLSTQDGFARGVGLWNHYGVHTLSLALRLMGFGVQRVLDSGTETARLVTLDYGNSRRALVEVRGADNAWDSASWRFGVRVANEYRTAPIEKFDDFYANLMRQAARFFTTGESDLTSGNLIETVAILEAADASQNAGGEWIPLQK